MVLTKLTIERPQPLWQFPEVLLGRKRQELQENFRNDVHMKFFPALLTMKKQNKNQNCTMYTSCDEWHGRNCLITI